jgi:NADH-quinone oxidoreductase subunit H
MFFITEYVVRSLYKPVVVTTAICFSLPLVGSVLLRLFAFICCILFAYVGGINDPVFVEKIWFNTLFEYSYLDNFLLKYTGLPLFTITKGLAHSLLNTASYAPSTSCNLDPQLLLLFGFLWTFLITTVGVLLATALLTLLERKIMASVQRRRGPNVVGFFGLLQPFADGLKLAIKETTVPRLAAKPLFILGPIVSFGLAIFGWVLIPFPTWLHSTKNYTDYSCFSCPSQLIPGSSAVDLDVGLLFLFVVVALHVYGVLFGGWGSNSRYALLGALRATAQSISYELVMGFTLLILALCHGGFSLLVIIYDQSFVWNMFSLLPVFLIFYVCSLAELNRTPFDLVEAEGELVAGYNVEYSAMMFALYFLGEYISIIFSAFTTVTLFLGAWFYPSFFSLLTYPCSFLFSAVAFSFVVFLLSVFSFVIKITAVIVSSLMIRFVLPRYRYDQLMYIGWLVFLPVSLFLLIFYAYIVLS